MYKGGSVAVVVPAYNEAGLVGDVIDELPAYVDRAYVVDDCSTDGTWPEIQAHAAAINESDRQLVVADGGAAPGRRIEPIRHEENRGVGAAIKTGYRRSLADGMDVTAVINGDGQMDPAILDRFIEPVLSGAAGYAKGNRLSTAADREEMSNWRLFGNVVLTGLTKVSSGYWGMQDAQNGYTAISREALSAIDIDELYEGYGFLNDVLVALNVNDVSIVDVPMAATYGDESSGIRYTTFVPALSSLLLWNFVRRLRRRYVDRGVHPLVGCYLLGVVGTGVGAGSLLVRLLTAGAVGPQTTTAAAAVVVGVVSLVLAMVLDWRSTRELEVSGRGVVERRRRGETA